LAPDGAGDITDGRHFIQAGVFGQPENAARLVEKLRAADLPANKLPLTVGERQLTRVLVGPYQAIVERDSALEAVRKLGLPDATPARG
jgi:cell division septation protein DedD